MPDLDSLAFAIRFALTKTPIGQEARKLIRSLPEAALEHLCVVVADHLRQCRWRQLPPEPRATGDQSPKVRSSAGGLSSFTIRSTARRMRAGRFSSGRILALNGAAVEVFSSPACR